MTSLTPKLTLTAIAIACVVQPLSFSASASPPFQTSTKPASQAPTTPQRTPDVPFVPSSDAVVTAMMSMAKVTKGDVVYDLGCGDGRIVIAAAKRGARGVGIDIDPTRIAEANARATAAGVASRVKFVLGDIFDSRIQISDATVVTLFLLPSLNERLKPRLLHDLKPGSRVVSNSFAMGADWPPDATEQVDRFVIYLWTLPAR